VRHTQEGVIRFPWSLAIISMRPPFDTLWGQLTKACRDETDQELTQHMNKLFRDLKSTIRTYRSFRTGTRIPMPMTGPESTPLPFPLGLVEEGSACAATGKRHITANSARSSKDTEDTAKAGFDFECRGYFFLAKRGRLGVDNILDL